MTEPAVASPAVDPAAAEAAADEAFWLPVQRAFPVDRGIVNLNNGGVSPSPAVVLEAWKRYIDVANGAPAYQLWQVLEPQYERVRARLAALFGCDPEELALTRNASEGLEICQLGFDLERGDEVLTTNQDYPRMLAAWRQRERREGVVLRQFSLPVPLEEPAEVVDLFERHLTPRTRLILISQVVNLTGQILPVREVVAMGRRHGVPVLVDGSHAIAHFPFTRDDLGCDYYAAPLHKWLCAPHGTGMLYVRRERIRDLWPLSPGPHRADDDVRKFEDVGTHSAAPFLAIEPAIDFHQGIGVERKAARLRHLRERWAAPLLRDPRVRLLTGARPELSCSFATFQIEGIAAQALADHLWSRHRILVTPFLHPEFEGVRITPSIYTTMEEVDRFTAAVEAVLEGGLP